MTARMDRTTIYLSDVDRDAIEAIKERFGVSRTSDAIRLALRMMATHRDAEEWPVNFGRPTGPR